MTFFHSDESKLDLLISPFLLTDFSHATFFCSAPFFSLRCRVLHFACPTKKKKGVSDGLLFRHGWCLFTHRRPPPANLSFGLHRLRRASSTPPTKQQQTKPFFFVFFFHQQAILFSSSARRPSNPLGIRRPPFYFGWGARF
jgi:hypothetical protein